jgi:hypothetical protein
MKVRVSYTAEVTDDYRRALAFYRGDESGRMATRQELKDWFWLNGQTEDDDIMQCWERHCEERDDD